MKTAIQIAVESYKNDGVSFTDWFLDNYEILLEKEKEQITDAHWAGWGHAYDYYVTEAESYDSQAVQAEDYYNETYNQNK